MSESVERMTRRSLLRLRPLGMMGFPPIPILRLPGFALRHAEDGEEKYDLATAKAEILELPLSEDSYFGGYRCAGGVDLAVDEHGLWVIYTTEANEERLVISKIDERSFTLSETWNTDSPRMSRLDPPLGFSTKRTRPSFWPRTVEQIDGGPAVGP